MSSPVSPSPTLCAENALTFPPHFRLPNLLAISAPFFELKDNKNFVQASTEAQQWFQSFNIYDAKYFTKWFKAGRFDTFASMAFPEADRDHLETCIDFLMWAVAADDFTDEGELAANPEEVQRRVNLSLRILYDIDAPVPEFPYAALLQSLLKRIRSTATEGTCTRFARGVEEFSLYQVRQSQHRAALTTPTVEDYLVLRRGTIGGPMIGPIVEYSLDIKIPNYVFEHPTVIAIGEAAIDIMMLPNDLCSFNKEQAEGDYQNLVFIIMKERNTDLQTSIDAVTKMWSSRVKEYTRLKNSLPSFGSEVDSELAVYYKNLERFMQGAVAWHYKSPRYFGTVEVDITKEEDVIIDLFPTMMA